MAMPSKSFVLFSGSGVANTAFDTGQFSTADFDALSVHVVGVGGTLAASSITLTAYDATGAVLWVWGTSITAGATRCTFGAGVGVGGSVFGGSAQAPALPLGSKLAISVPAQGIGVSVSVTVGGRRNHRGPDVHINAD